MKLTPNSEPPVLVTERQRVEYERFGPWAFPVKGPEEMPPRFDAFYEELRASDLILKLPRPIERRMTEPGADLYDRILAVGSGGVVYLSLSQDEVLRCDVPFGGIEAIRLVQELLYGVLCLDIAGSTISVPFNTVSADVFKDFVDIVRRSCASESQARPFVPIEDGPEPSDEDMLSKNLLREFRKRDPSLALLAYQAPCLLKPMRENVRGLMGWAASLLPRRVDGGFLAANPSELLLVVCGTGVPRIGRLKGYRYEVIRIPNRSLRDAHDERRLLANGAPIHALHLSTAGHDYTLFFESDTSSIFAEV